MHTRKIALGLLLLGAAACDESPVSLPEPAGVTVAAATMALAVGDEAPVAAQVVDQDGRVMQGQAVVYSTDNASVATVGTDGMVHAVAPGTANVTAASGASTAAVKVTVTPDRRGELQTLDVMADSVVTDWRAGVQAVAVRAVNGFGQAVCPEVTLRTSDRAVATARTAGACRIEVVPSFTGEAVITAEAGGRTDTFRVRITSSGQIAFISSRPSSDQLVAGATVSYTVRVLDQVSRPIANQRVYFETSVGTLSANSVITGEDGTATVEWHIPTDLRNLGQNHWFAFRALLPNGVLDWHDEDVFINGASLAEILLYRAGNTFTRLTSGSITVPAYSFVTLGASGVDQYGNVRATNFTFSITGGYSIWNCGGSNGTLHSSGIEYTCYYRGPGTTTLTATAPDGQQKSVEVIFN